jgi:hypothetical protein
MNPGNSPWLTLHEVPGSNEVVGRDGVTNPPVAIEGEAALAIATGPIPAIAQVIPAMTVKRFSEDNISVSLCREVGATCGEFEADANFRAHPAACGLTRTGRKSVSSTMAVLLGLRR